jgi:hypothetical protein
MLESLHQTPFIILSVFLGLVLLLDATGACGSRTRMSFPTRRQSRPSAKR